MARQEATSPSYIAVGEKSMSSTLMETTKLRRSSGAYKIRSSIKKKLKIFVMAAIAGGCFAAIISGFMTIRNAAAENQVWQFEQIIKRNVKSSCLK